MKKRTKKNSVKTGIDLRHFKEKAIDAGVTITTPHATGEIRFDHPLMDKPLVLNVRRKSTEPSAAVWLRKLWERQAAETAEVCVSTS